jgi:parvulin-like peptidyl-prolyl isomerase
VRGYYEIYRSRFVLPARLRARHIFYAALDHPDGEARDLAEATLADLQAGGDFAALARERSEDLKSGPDGGELNWMVRERLPHDFSEQVFALPEGEPTVVRTLLGAHVIEVTARKPARERSFAEVREELVVALSNQRREAGLRQYLKVLRYRDRHKLEVFEEMLERPWSLKEA